MRHGPLSVGKLDEDTADSLTRSLLADARPPPPPRGRAPRDDGGGGGGGGPTCGCNKPAVEKTVVRDTANKDRKFWSCSAPQGEGCGFFVSAYVGTKSLTALFQSTDALSSDRSTRNGATARLETEEEVDRPSELSMEYVGLPLFSLGLAYSSLARCPDSIRRSIDPLQPQAPRPPPQRRMQIDNDDDDNAYGGGRGSGGGAPKCMCEMTSIQRTVGKEGPNKVSLVLDAHILLASIS